MTVTESFEIKCNPVIKDDLSAIPELRKKGKTLLKIVLDLMIFCITPT